MHTARKAQLNPTTPTDGSGGRRPVKGRGGVGGRFHTLPLQTRGSSNVAEKALSWAIIELDELVGINSDRDMTTNQYIYMFILKAAPIFPSRAERASAPCGFLTSSATLEPARTACAHCTQGGGGELFQAERSGLPVPLGPDACRRRAKPQRCG